MAPFDAARDRNDEFMLWIYEELVFQLRFDIVPSVQRADGPIRLHRVGQMGEGISDRKPQSAVIVFCIVKAEAVLVRIVRVCEIGECGNSQFVVDAGIVDVERRGKTRFPTIV